MEATGDTKILFKYEYPLKWRDLPQIRASLSIKLSAAAIPRRQADPVIIIISELVENAFKYSDYKLATIILKQDLGVPGKIIIKIHHPVSNYQTVPLKRLLVDIAQVNAAADIDQIYLESLREATYTNTKANRFRLALIRKTAQGSLIHLQKSMLYKPGISIGVIYPLPE